MNSISKRVASFDRSGFARLLGGGTDGARGKQVARRGAGGNQPSAEGSLHEHGSSFAAFARFVSRRSVFESSQEGSPVRDRREGEVRARSPPPSRGLGCHDLRAKVPSIPRTRRRTRAHPAPSLHRSPPNQTRRYDVPDLRRRSTREQRLHHQHPGVGRPAGVFRATILIYSSAPAPTHFIFTVRAPPFAPNP